MRSFIIIIGCCASIFGASDIIKLYSNEEDISYYDNFGDNFDLKDINENHDYEYNEYNEYTEYTITDHACETEFLMSDAYENMEILFTKALMYDYCAIVGICATAEGGLECAILLKFEKLKHVLNCKGELKNIKC